MSKENKIWIENSKNIFYLQNVRNEHIKLSNNVFILNQDALGNLFLQKISDSFEFGYKMYAIENKFVDRVKKTFQNTEGNLGMLMNGMKGTGKTVTAKMICNALEQPTIIVDSDIPGGHLYLNDIPQNITIFVDEYEKIYGDDKALLTIMDGALNSEHRRVFLLTTNNLYVSENMLQRPSRIRYLKTFVDLSPEIITEILQDLIVNKALLKDTFGFITTLEIITVDIVKAICQEVNIHDEVPSNFADIFNVKRMNGKFDIYITNEAGDVKLLRNKVRVSPFIFDEEDSLHRSIQIDGNYVGEIVEVINESTVKVNAFVQKGSDIYVLLKNLNPTTPKLNGGNVSYNRRNGRNSKENNEEIEINCILKVEESFMYNKRVFDEYGLGF